MKKKLLFSSFQVIRTLGDGSSSVVRECRMREPERHGYPACYPTVALKLIMKNKLDPDSILSTSDGVSLPMEIYLLRDLKETPCPYIVEMIDGWEDSQFYYVMMPLHGEGMDLFTFIEENSPIDGRRVLMIFTQVLKAIKHLHNTMNIVHLDLKDENIIIDERDRIKLVDFGSSAIINPSSENEPVIFKTFKGTVGYASPELLVDPNNLSYTGKEQDIFALGVLLYVLSFSKLPFNEEDKERSSLLFPQDNIHNSTPKETQDLIKSLLKRMLHPTPEKRPKIEEILEDVNILKYYNKEF